MFSYYLALGIRSLSNQRLITIWMILLIALGVAGTVSTFLLLRAVSSNPFAAEAHRLFAPQIDNHGPDYVKTNGIDPVLTLRDVEALRAHDGAHLQAAIYQIDLSLVPTDTTMDALEAKGYAVTVDYFQMMGVPFRFGSAWSKEADREGSNQVVIGNELNQKVFRGVNSVGQEIRLDGHTYRISGVLAPWNPLPRFYAASDHNAFDRHAPQLFMPFRQALNLRIPTAGGSYGESSFQPWDMRSEISFISYWVELPDSAAAAHYGNYLHAYADEQRVAGRFHWPANVALRDQQDWLDYQHVVPPEARISFVVALGLLVVCAVNTVGLLLARFMRRSSDIGIVGIIADVEVPEKRATRDFAYRSVLMPVRLADVAGDPYIVRTQPGAAEHVRKSLADVLYKTSRLRILDRQEGIQRFRTLRTKAYAADRGLVILLTAASIILLLATAGGIIGMTTLWVEGRRRTLGMRRALGARRRDILAYILAENFFIVLLGICCGSIIALTANISLMHYLALKSLPPAYVTLTSLFVLVLGQCAALPPARRAARVPPAEAMRIVY